MNKCFMEVLVIPDVLFCFYTHFDVCVHLAAR